MSHPLLASLLSNVLAYAGSCCREEGFGLPGQGCGVEDGWREDQDVAQVQELSPAQGWFLVQHGRIGAGWHAPDACKDSADAGDKASHAERKGCESRASSSTSLGKRARDDETDDAAIALSAMQQAHDAQQRPEALSLWAGEQPVEVGRLRRQLAGLHALWGAFITPKLQSEAGAGAACGVSEVSGRG